MRLSRRLLAGLLLLLPSLAAAETFPAKPIRLIVPFPAGGPNDIIARVIGQRMSELGGQPVVIDNRGGQGGVLGTDAVAKAAPDGYTIAISSAGALVISPSMEKVAYDTLAIHISNSRCIKQQARVRILAACFARALLRADPLPEQRAQGRPGAGWHPLARCAA
jgi:hypothetical protein